MQPVRFMFTEEYLDLEKARDRWLKAKAGITTSGDFVSQV